MELTIVPSQCKVTKDESGAEIAPLFSGSLKIKVPNMVESYRFKAKFGKKTVGMTEVEGKNQQAFATMELLADISEAIQPSILSVDLVDLKTNKSIKSVEDLYYCEAAFPIISEVAMMFIQGFVEKES